MLNVWLVLIFLIRNASNKLISFKCKYELKNGLLKFIIRNMHQMSLIFYVWFQIDSGRKEYKASISTSKALYRNYFMINCDLGVPTHELLNENATNGKGFDISLSYDGIHFSRTLTLVIFDPECMSCSSRPTYCQQKVVYIYNLKKQMFFRT